MSGCNRAFNNPEYTEQSVGECSHAFHIRVHHFLLRHVSIRGIRLRDAKLGNISVLNSFVSWRTDYWCCRSGAARWNWAKLNISPQVFQISIVQFTGFLSTKVINNEPYKLAFQVLSSSKLCFHNNVSVTAVRTPKHKYRHVTTRRMDNCLTSVPYLLDTAKQDGGRC